MEINQDSCLDPLHVITLGNPNRWHCPLVEFSVQIEFEELDLVDLFFL